MSSIRKESGRPDKKIFMKSDREPRPKPSGVEGVPTLKFGNNNNFAQVEQALLTLARIKFGRLGDIFRTHEYYVLPQIQYDQEDLDDPIQRRIIETRVTEREKAMIKMEQDRPALYSMIWGVMQTDGQEACRKAENFEEAEASLDPLLLWLIVKPIHESGVQSTNVAVIKQQTRRTYNALKQYAHESVPEFKQRFDSVRNARREAGNEDIPESDAAHDFFDATCSTTGTKTRRVSHQKWKRCICWRLRIWW